VDLADGKTKPSRSDPVPQPTTTQDAVRDLHALLRAANERGPYVLVGHSFGGLVARLYASTYPNEVAGMVLVDPASEAFQAALKRMKAYDTWKATRTGGRLSLTTDQLARYPELERLDYDRSFDQLRAAAPLHPMPLVLLSSDHSIQKALEPLIAAGTLPPGIPADFGTISDKAWKEGQDHDSQLVSNITHITKTDSGHNIQLEQPQLVIDAIRKVVVAVRNSEGSGDFGRLVDIGGGRKMYLRCSGTGSPTVVLVGGLRASADDWSISDKSKPAVFPEASKFTRVCACDRPGTPVGEKPSRSDPVQQPTTAKDAVADLHVVLSAAGEKGPYVLVGHSYGGLIVRLYASTYPKEVSGLVLIDALSEGLQDAEKPEQWAIQRKLIEGDVRESVALYPALERIDVDRSFNQIRTAPALPSVPLVVLSADRPWGPQVPPMIAAGKLPADIPQDFGYVTDAAQKKAQEWLANLVPNAKHITNTNSGHEIHKEQPQLVIDAIRQVVAAVRNHRSAPSNFQGAK
jgi:pimeloyl-ACP methyl ester carboxylesterase